MAIVTATRGRRSTDRYFKYKKIDRRFKNTLTWRNTLVWVDHTDGNGVTQPVRFQFDYTSTAGDYRRNAAAPLTGHTPVMDTADATLGRLHRQDDYWNTRCIVRTATAGAGHTTHTDCTLEQFYDNQDRHANLELRETENMGIGVFTIAVIPANTAIGVYSGHLKPAATLTFDDTRYCNQIGLTGPPRDIPIVSDLQGNWTRFINSHCGSNCVFSHRYNCGDSAVSVVRTGKNDIAAGEQLFVDYGQAYFREAERDDDGELFEEQRIIPPGCMCGFKGTRRDGEKNCHSKTRKRKALKPLKKR